MRRQLHVINTLTEVKDCAAMKVEADGYKRFVTLVRHGSKDLDEDLYRLLVEKAKHYDKAIGEFDLAYKSYETDEEIRKLRETINFIHNRTVYDVEFRLTKYIVNGEIKRLYLTIILYMNEVATNSYNYEFLQSIETETFEIDIENNKCTLVSKIESAIQEKNKNYTIAVSNSNNYLVEFNIYDECAQQVCKAVALYKKLATRIVFKIKLNSYIYSYLNLIINDIETNCFEVANKRDIYSKFDLVGIGKEFDFNYNVYIDYRSNRDGTIQHYVRAENYVEGYIEYYCVVFKGEECVKTELTKGEYIIMLAAKILGM